MSSEWGTRAERPHETIGERRSPSQRSACEVDTLDRLERQLRRLAFDLHDGLMQSLAAARLQSDLIASLASGEECTSAAHELRSMLDDALNELRDFVLALRPPALDAVTLAEMLRDHVAGVSADAGLAIRLDIDDRIPDISTSARIALFRIVQEALNNTVEHARACHAAASIGHRDGVITCEVTDDGCGFHVSEAGLRAHQGMGLRSMRERAQLLGGDVLISSVPGEGTSVVARIPVWS